MLIYHVKLFDLLEVVKSNFENDLNSEKLCHRGCCYEVVGFSYANSVL